jgi:hypothetical protein
MSSTLTPLTTREEIERVYSANAVLFRLDDAATPEDADNIIEDIIAWATETVVSYTLHHYDTVNLAASAWARRRTTILACYYLSQRRGNPPQFVAEAKRVMEDLTLVRDNKVLIPDIPVRAADVPTVSSFRIDDRYAINKQRVVSSQSTKPYAGQQLYETPYISGGDV